MDLMQPEAKKKRFSFIFAKTRIKLSRKYEKYLSKPFPQKKIRRGYKEGPNTAPFSDTCTTVLEPVQQIRVLPRPLECSVCPHEVNISGYGFKVLLKGGC